MSEKYSVDDIIKLMQAVNTNKLSEFELEDNDFKLEIKGGVLPSVNINAESQCFETIEISDVPTQNYVSQVKNNDTEQGVVTSPIVGTFYASSAPDKPAYVNVGDKVEKGDILFIVESMKLMNEVTSDFSGEVIEIFTENEDPIEYGQPIMIIR